MAVLAPGRRLLALGLLPAALVSCAERLAEDGPAAARASKLEFAITPMVGGSAVDFTWQPRNAGYPRLSSYRLDIGQGSNDLASIEFPGTQTSFRWMPAPVGELHAQVATLEGSKVVTFSDHVVIKSIDPRQMIDALLFASGPLVPSHDPGRELSSDRVLGWGAQALDLIVSESLPVTALSALERAARQVRTATRDRILPAIARAPEPLPRARSGEVTIAMVSPQEAESRCGGVGDDCVIVYYWPARMSIDRAEILLPSSPTGSLAWDVVHGLGHVLGLAHIDMPRPGFAPPFAMGPRNDFERYDVQLNELDYLDVSFDPGTLWLLETMFERGLTFGTRRREYVAAGLVPPDPDASSQSSRRRPAATATQQAEETVVRFACRRRSTSSRQLERRP